MVRTDLETKPAKRKKSRAKSMAELATFATSIGVLSFPFAQPAAADAVPEGAEPITPPVPTTTEVVSTYAATPADIAQFDVTNTPEGAKVLEQFYSRMSAQSSSLMRAPNPASGEYRVYAWDDPATGHNTTVSSTPIVGTFSRMRDGAAVFTKGDEVAQAVATPPPATLDAAAEGTGTPTVFAGGFNVPNVTRFSRTNGACSQDQNNVWFQFRCWNWYKAEGDSDKNLDYWGFNYGTQGYATGSQGMDTLWVEARPNRGDMRYAKSQLPKPGSATSINCNGSQTISTSISVGIPIKGVNLGFGLSNSQTVNRCEQLLPINKGQAHFAMKWSKGTAGGAPKKSQREVSLNVAVELPEGQYPNYGLLPGACFDC